MRKRDEEDLKNKVLEYGIKKDTYELSDTEIAMIGVGWVLQDYLELTPADAKMMLEGLQYICTRTLKRDRQRTSLKGKIRRLQCLLKTLNKSSL